MPPVIKLEKAKKSKKKFDGAERKGDWDFACRRQTKESSAILIKWLAAAPYGIGEEQDMHTPRLSGAWPV